MFGGKAWLCICCVLCPVCAADLEHALATAARRDYEGIALVGSGDVQLLLRLQLVTTVSQKDFCLPM